MWDREKEFDRTRLLGARRLEKSASDTGIMAEAFFFWYIIFEALLDR